MPKRPELYWELHEPAFPHGAWRIYAGGLVTKWDGQLVNFRIATPEEKSDLYMSLNVYMQMSL